MQRRKPLQGFVGVLNWLKKQREIDVDDIEESTGTVKPFLTMEKVMKYITTLLVGIFIGFLITIGSIYFAFTQSTVIIQIKGAK
jgi:hypothetical protein